MRPRIGITSSPAEHDERYIDRVNRWYVDAVLRAGGLPLILPTLAPADVSEVLDELDGLLLTGGGDVAAWQYGEEVAPEAYGIDPARDAWELALVEGATTAPSTREGDTKAPTDPAEGAIPILGVCRGAQLLNVAAGGSLIQHLPHITDEQHWQRGRETEEVHSVDIEAASRLAGLVGTRLLGVNSIHHQSIGRVGEGFRAVAWASDGVVEAIERIDDAPILAVQWHPESLIDGPHHGQLFLWLTRAAAVRRPGLEVPDAFRPPAPLPPVAIQLVDDVA